MLTGTNGHGLLFPFSKKELHMHASNLLSDEDFGFQGDGKVVYHW